MDKEKKESVSAHWKPLWQKKIMSYADVCKYCWIKGKEGFSWEEGALDCQVH